MIITFVIDDYTTLTNGTVMTAFRTAEALKKLGHEIRIVAIGVTGNNMYSLEERYIPLVSDVSKKQSIHFAKANKEVLELAIQGSDIVHFFLPWKVSKVANKIAKKLNVATTAGFHCPPESITYNACMKHVPFITNILYRRFRSGFYKNFDNIHCVSKLFADKLKKFKYKAKIHIISNGVDPDFVPPKAPVERKDDKFNILMISRLAAEKRHDVVIKAINESKYRDKIQLNCAGAGPLKKKVEKMGQMLPNPPKINFYTKSQLIDAIYHSDLYVHAADVETEGMACIEAFACGVVPIISNAKKSAATQFALDERCLFKQDDYKDLAKKIDYMIEHPNEKEELSKLYIDQAKYYNIDNSAKKLEEMFKQAISDQKAKAEKAKTKPGKKIKKRIEPKNAVRNLLSFVVYYGLAYPVLFILNKFATGLKIIGKDNLKAVKRTGAVSISNHVHTLDCTMAALASFPRRPIFTTLPSNLKLPVAGKLVNILGAVPVPITPNESSVFFYELSKRINQGKIVHFYPEGELIKYDDKLREFKKGAFYLAVVSKAPILPMTITFMPRKNPKRKPKVVLTIEKPIYPDYKLLKNDAIKKLQKECEEVMNRIIDLTTKYVEEKNIEIDKKKLIKVEKNANKK